MEQETKLSFFKRVWISIKDFEKYQIFALENFRRSIKYLLQLMLLFVLVISITFTFRFAEILQQGISYFKEEIPNLSFTNHTLQVEQTEPIVIEGLEGFSGIVIIDTISETETTDQELEKLKTYDNGVLILKDKILFKNAMTSMVGSYMYEDLINQYGIQESFEKQDMINWLVSMNYMAIYATFFSITTIYLLVLYFSAALVDAIILAVLGYLTARFSKLKFKFKPILSMAIHALTLPILLNAIYIVINITTGFEIKYFQMMYTTISYIYMVTAILMIKSDMIKQQMELMALQEEQKRVKEELEAEKERKRLEEEEKERKKNREEKKKEKEKEEEESKLKPRGNEG